MLCGWVVVGILSKLNSDYVYVDEVYVGLLVLAAVVSIVWMREESK